VVKQSSPWSTFILGAAVATVLVVADAGKSRAGPSEAPEGKWSSVAASASTEDAGSLINGERLNLRVRGYAELSGEYRVNSDQTISIAGLGRVPINTLSPSEFEEHLSERLSAAMRREITVSVEVARYKPFFVTGHVAQPGAIEWQPGLTLIQAISLAGGVARSPTRSEIDTPERGLMIEQARSQLRFALAQLARLKAEKEGKDTVEATRVLDKLLESSPLESRQALKSFISRQNEMLAEQRELIRTRIARLENEHEIASGELDAARAQEKEIRKQLNNSAELAESLERLKNEHLVASSRYLAQQRDLIDSKVRASESHALVERAQGRLNSLGREIETVQQERRLLLNDRIEGLEREVAQLELTLRDAGVSVGSTAEPPPALTYHIARKSSAGVRPIVANLFTEVYAGDVVIISSETRTLQGVTAAPDNSAPKSALERTQHIMEFSATPRSIVGRLLAGRRSSADAERQ
jgi:polysaccharide biosynthesis/export protein ExoF